MSYKETIALTQESINLFEVILSTYQLEAARKGLEITINEVKKCIPTKPIQKMVAKSLPKLRRWLF